MVLLAGCRARFCSTPLRRNSSLVSDSTRRVCTLQGATDHVLFTQAHKYTHAVGKYWLTLSPGRVLKWPLYVRTKTLVSLMDGDFKSYLLTCPQLFACPALVGIFLGSFTTGRAAWPKPMPLISDLACFTMENEHRDTPQYTSLLSPLRLRT